MSIGADLERTDEIWTEVPGFPHYQVSSYGNIYNSRAKRMLEPHLHRPSGSSRVALSSYRGRRDVYIHQLVAECFMGDYSPGLIIEHVDGNKQNNHISNLRPKGGNTLAVARYEANHIRGGKIRVVETGQVFLNAYSAARHFNTDASTIYKVLRGERKRALGMRFEVYREGGVYEQ